MKKSITDSHALFCTAAGMLAVLAVLLACVDTPVTSDDEPIPDIARDTFAITILFPVNQSSIVQDTAEYSGIAWGALEGAHSYRIFVYDSADDGAVHHVVNSRDNACTIGRYTVNRSYLVEVFAVVSALLTDRIGKDSVAGDTLYDSVKVAMEFVSLVFTDSTYPDHLIDSLKQGGYSSVDPSFMPTYGYYCFSTKPDTFTIHLDTTLPQNAFRFLPDDYQKSFKMGFYLYPSPDSLWITTALQNVTVSWDTVAGLYVTQYRAYLRDFTGRVIAFRDTLCDSIVNDTIAVVNKVQSVTFGDIIGNTVYKINVATQSALGPGSLDSNVAAIAADSAHASFLLPHHYVSTFSTPPPQPAMIGVRGGMAIMGRTWNEPAGFCPGTLPVHEAVIPSFYLGRYEVTCAEYAEFLRDIDSAHPGALRFYNDTLKLGTIPLADTSSSTWYITGSFTVVPGRERYPVVSLYWHGAAAYCNWLSKKEELDTCYDAHWIRHIYANGYRLPTEAEFEYAASGSFTGLKQRFSWGLSWDTTRAVVGGKELDTVGSYLPYHGLYHLIGNAMEYAGNFSDYTTGPGRDSSAYYIGCRNKGVMVNPTGPARGTDRMLRGGSFASGEQECTSYARYLNPPAARIAEYGFRIARNADQNLR